MRSHTLKMFTLAAMLAIPTAYAQVSHHVMADIPFAFTVNNQVLPAGEYEVSDGAARGTVVIQSEDRQHSAILVANAAEATDQALEGKLVFHHYGNRYFLHEIFAPGVVTGRELLPTKVEREMANSHAGSNVEVAAPSR